MMENVNGKSARFKNVRKSQMSVKLIYLVKLWIVCEFTLASGQNVTFGDVVNETKFARLSVSDKKLSQISLLETDENEQNENHNRFNKSENSNPNQSASKSNVTKEVDFDNLIREFVATNLFTSNKSNISEHVLYLIKTHKWKNKNKNQVNEIAKKSKRSGPSKKLSVNLESISLRSAQRPIKKLSNERVKMMKSVADIPKIFRNENATSESKKLSKVSLLGLFELTTPLGADRWEGRSELAAAKLAVRHINEFGLLPGYNLELITNDTQVSVCLFEHVNIIC